MTISPFKFSLVSDFAAHTAPSVWLSSTQLAVSASMKRMGAPSGSFDVERNMSYTNLAAMASSFETGARLVPAGGATRTGGSQAQMEAIYAKAQALIATGCEL